jgi:hypothetical protein
MIVEIDFGNEEIRYISCSTKVGKKMNKLEDELIHWFHDKSKNKKYWIEDEDVGESIPVLSAHAVVDWLNNVKFKKGTAKAKEIEFPDVKAKKKIYIEHLYIAATKLKKI